MEEDEKKRLFAIRCASKRGLYVSREDMEFSDKMFREHRKEYSEMSDKVFQETKPFGAF